MGWLSTAFKAIGGASGVGSILSGAGGIASGIMGSINANKAIKVQQQENEKNRQFAQQMWEQNNAYNTPSAQIQRLKDAGLNPNLAYGNIDAGSASSVSPSAQSLDGSYLANRPTVGSMLSGVGDAVLKKAQIDNIQADTKKKEVEAGESLSRVRVNESTVDLQSVEGQKLKKDMEYISQMMEESDARIMELQAHTSNLKADEQKKWFDMVMEDKRYQMDFAESKARIEKFGAETRHFNSLSNLTDAEYQFFMASYASRLGIISNENVKSWYDADISRVKVEEMEKLLTTIDLHNGKQVIETAILTKDLGWYGWKNAPKIVGDWVNVVGESLDIFLRAAAATRGFYVPKDLTDPSSRKTPKQYRAATHP